MLRFTISVIYVLDIIAGIQPWPAFNAASLLSLNSADGRQHRHGLTMVLDTNKSTRFWADTQVIKMREMHNYGFLMLMGCECNLARICV